MIDSKKRNINLDILRILSMFMIVILHFLSKGGVLWNTEEYTAMWFVVWFIEAVCLAGVNCFVLLSAYFLSQTKNEMRWSKVVELLFSMIFYSWIVGIVLKLAGFTFGIKSLISTVFPFLTKSYWFINTYILLYILFPYINRALDNIGKKKHRVIMAVLLVFFSVGPSILPYSDWTMDSTGGYGIIWFVTLYVVGNYLSKYQIRVNRTLCIILCVLSGGLCVGSRYMITRFLGGYSTLEGLPDIWYAYNSVPVFLVSICLFLLFMGSTKAKAKNSSTVLQRVITFFSAGTLGVYLFHEQSLFKTVLWKDILHVDLFYNSWLVIVYMIFVCLLIFIIGCSFDCIRRLMWNQVFKQKLFKRLYACENEN